MPGTQFAGTRPPRQAGARIGPFRLERRLGGGRFTEVWRADADGIIVALKLLRAETPGSDGDPLVRARLAREAASLRRLDHPGVAQLLDAGEEPEGPYLAFVFEDAAPLARALDDGRLGAHVTAALASAVAAALAHAHGRDVVHRDVTPANILLADDGPVLVDFEHSAIAGAVLDGWIQGAPALAATPGYSPPEATRERPSPAGDVWALGKVVLECVTGARSLAGTASVGPAGLDILVREMLAPDPARRPGAADVSERMGALAGGARPHALHILRLAPIPAVRDRPAPASAGPDVVPAPREAEVSALVAACESGVAVGELRAVLVSGPPGAGKSWLLRRATEEAAHAGFRVLTAACTAATADIRALRPWFRTVLEHSGGPDRALRDALGSTHAGVLGPALGLAARGGVGGGDEAARVSDAVAAALTWVATRGPGGGVVCGIEDCHHADPGLRDLLGSLACRPGLPGALWCSSRPGGPDGDDLGAETLALQPLPDAHVAALATGLWGRGLPAEAVAEVVQVARGNPLHAREAVLALRRGADPSASTGLRELIAARLATYSPAARGAIECAAACGETFWPEAVGGELLDWVPVMFRDGLAVAHVQSELPSSTQATFSHPMFREAAYGAIPPRRRRAIHAHLARRVDSAGASAETVAFHAGVAFRLGEAALAGLAGVKALAATRAALDRYSLAAADEWLDLLRDTDVDVAPGETDLLEAELHIARGEFRRASDLLGPHTDGPGATGRRALVLATEASLGCGDLPGAERLGALGRERLAGDPAAASAHAVAYGRALVRLGRFTEAIGVFDEAAADARSVGDDGLAGRLAALAADAAAEARRLEGGDFAGVLVRQREALALLESGGDDRGFVRAAAALLATLAVDDPHAAFATGLDAARRARTLGDEVSLGQIAYWLCDLAVELGDVAALDEWLPHLARLPLPESERLDADYLMASVPQLRSPGHRGTDRDLLACVAAMAGSGDAKNPDVPARMAVCVLMWQGRLAEARRVFEEVSGGFDPEALAMATLQLRALAGPPWTADDLAFASGTRLHNEIALLAYLRGDDEVADALLQARHDDLVATYGDAYQPFHVLFPGPLVAALGPPGSVPDTAWLTGWLLHPPFPGLWAVHRSAVGGLLARRGGPDAGALRRASLAALASVPADPDVRAWVGRLLGG